MVSKNVLVIQLFKQTKVWQTNQINVREQNL